MRLVLIASFAFLLAGCMTTERVVYVPASSGLFSTTQPASDGVPIQRSDLCIRC